MNCNIPGPPRQVGDLLPTQPQPDEDLERRARSRQPDFSSIKGTFSFHDVSIADFPVLGAMYFDRGFAYGFLPFVEHNAPTDIFPVRSHAS